MQHGPVGGPRGQVVFPRWRELNAFTHLDRAFEARVTQSATGQWTVTAAATAAGAAHLPLAGCPIVVKDNIEVAGMPCTLATPALRNYVARRDAPAVARLRDAGAEIIGKANLHELAYGITSNNPTFGPVRNVHDLSCFAGGSSGGTAAAIAAGLVRAGLGTDTGGSSRIPAALCGIVGFRPSSGRWPQRGIVPISHTRDTAGPMARSVGDCALLDAVVTGGKTAAAGASLKGMRIGVPRRHFWEGLDDEVGRIGEDALRRIREAGATLVDVDLGEAAALAAECGFPIALYEARADIGRYLAEHGNSLDFEGLVQRTASPDVKAVLQGLSGAGAVPEAAYRRAMATLRPTLQEAYRRLFRDQGAAAVIFPTTPLPAAAIGEDETVIVNGTPRPTFPTFIRNCEPASLAGIPGVSLPAGMTAEGLPVGIEIDGPEGSDAELLGIGAALEAVLPHQPAPPLRSVSPFPAI